VAKLSTLPFVNLVVGGGRNQKCGIYYTHIYLLYPVDPRMPLIDFKYINYISDGELKLNAFRVSKLLEKR